MVAAILQMQLVISDFAGQSIPGISNIAPYSQN
jgi:hypothetical protein